jgi:hypothetical protein
MILSGQLAHKEKIYPGQHEAIIEPELWQAVQDRLAAGRRERSMAVGAEAPSLLSGLIFDSGGARLSPTHGKRYRYYVSTALITRSRSEHPKGRRIPAGDIEGLVLDRDVSNALLPQNSSGLLPQRTHCYVGRPVGLLARRRAYRDVRGFGSCERQFRRREPTEPNTMSTLSIAKSRNPKSAAPKKGSAQSKTASLRKVTSPAAHRRDLLNRRPCESAAAKTPRKADEPKVERVTKQERVLTPEPTRGSQHRRDDAGDGLAAAQRARVPGGHREKEARFPADIIQAQRRRSPLLHRNAARSLTWTKRRSMSQRRWCGSRS